MGDVVTSGSIGGNAGGPAGALLTGDEGGATGSVRPDSHDRTGPGTSPRG